MHALYFVFIWPSKFAYLYCLRPYHVESTSSRPIIRLKATASKFANLATIVKNCKNPAGRKILKLVKHRQLWWVFVPIVIPPPSGWRLTPPRVPLRIVLSERWSTTGSFLCGKLSRELPSTKLVNSLLDTSARWKDNKCKKISFCYLSEFVNLPVRKVIYLHDKKCYNSPVLWIRLSSLSSGQGRHW